MSDGAIVRPAAGDDVDELARLRWQLYAEDDPAVGESFEDYRERFVRFATTALEDENWRAWVAEDGGRIVAALWRHRTPRIPQPGRGDPAPLAYITNVYVEPPTGIRASARASWASWWMPHGPRASRSRWSGRATVRSPSTSGAASPGSRTRWSWTWAAIGTTEDRRERATPS